MSVPDVASFTTADVDLLVGFLDGIHVEFGAEARRDGIISIQVRKVNSSQSTYYIRRSNTTITYTQQRQERAVSYIIPYRYDTPHLSRALGPTTTDGIPYRSLTGQHREVLTIPAISSYNTLIHICMCVLFMKKKPFGCELYTWSVRIIRT